MIIYLAGLLTVTFLPSLNNSLWFLLLLPLLLFVRLRYFILLYMTGILVAVSYGCWQLHHRLPLAFDRSDVELSGYVISIPEINEHRVRFIVDIDQIDTDKAVLQRLRRVRVNLYSLHKKGALPLIESGDHLAIKVRLRAPHFLNNPDAYDLEKHFLIAGWDAQATLIELIERQPQQHFLHFLRGELKKSLQTHFQVSDAEWILPAIVLGDRKGLGSDTWEILQRTGTAHLFVVSGLHIAVISGSGMLLGRILIGLLLLCGVNTTRMRGLPLLLGFIMATAYAFLAGFNLPVQRAWIMVSVFLIGEWTLLGLSGWMRWRIALVLVMTHSPLAVIQPGAWMSFAAVALLLLMANAFKSLKPSGLMALIRAQWMIFIGLLPVLAWVFQQLGLIAPLVNLAVIPIFSIFVMSLPFTLSLALADVGWSVWFIDTFLQYFWSSLSILSSFNWGVFQLVKPSMLMLLMTLPLWFLLLVPLPWRWKWVGCLVFLPLLWPEKVKLSDSDFRVIVFDVGQGLAVLVETQEHLLIYDTGPGYVSGGSAWPYAVAPWFESRGQDSISHLVVSHQDLDHAGGLDDLNDQLEIAHQFAGSESMLQQGFESCHQQQSWDYHQIEFRFLTEIPSKLATNNERSCVLEIRNEYCSLLLPGDIGHSTEYDLIRSQALQPVDWLVAGHHGSKSSSSDAFLDHTMPQAVIYTAGFANRYGHPSPEVTSRVRQRQIQEFNTATDGAVWLEAINGSCTISTQRKRKRRYWTSA